MNRRILHAATIIYFIVGMFYFYLMPGYPTGIYFVFAKLFDLLLILCIIYPLSEFRYAWFILSIFFAVRLLWEIPAIRDYEAASRAPIIFSLFLCNVLCLISILSVKIIKNRKQRK